MFNQPNPDTARLDAVIDQLLLDMSKATPYTDEYVTMMDQLVKIQTLKTDSGPKRMSPDAKATIVANLAGIVVIVGHERASIVTSKALGFVKKLF